MSQPGATVLGPWRTGCSRSTSTARCCAATAASMTATSRRSPSCRPRASPSRSSPAGCTPASIGAARACAIDGAIALRRGQPPRRRRERPARSSHHAMSAEAPRSSAPRSRDHGLDDVRVRRRRHPPRRTPARRYARYVRTWSPQPARRRRGHQESRGRPSRSPRSRSATSDAVAAAHAALRAARGATVLRSTFAVARLPGQARAARARRRADQGHRARRAVPRSPAARSPRRSRSATGSTTCRCSRSPAGRSRWAARPTHVRAKATDALSAHGGRRRRHRRGDPASLGLSRPQLRPILAPPCG